MAKTATLRTLEWLRESGFDADVVEKWVNTHKAHNNRKDLFGFIDIVAMGSGFLGGHHFQGILGVQSTTASHGTDRCEKILASDKAPKWLENGGKIVVIGWRKYKKAIDGRYWRPTMWLIPSGLYADKVIDGSQESVHQTEL